MGTLVINDLVESVDLDRQAMAAITGGSMVQAHQTMLAPQLFTGLRIAAGLGEFAGEFAGRSPIAEAVAQRTRTTLLR
ncbi:hypothetical protein AAHK20_11650 [Trinickia sp. YCB016]